jgi:hypothetical protein
MKGHTRPRQEQYGVTWIYDATSRFLCFVQNQNEPGMLIIQWVYFVPAKHLDKNNVILFFFLAKTMFISRLPKKNRTSVQATVSLTVLSYLESLNACLLELRAGMTLLGCRVKPKRLFCIAGPKTIGS